VDCLGADKMDQRPRVPLRPTPSGRERIQPSIATTGRQNQSHAAACAACAMDGPVFRYTSTSHDPLVPQRAEGSRQHRCRPRQAAPAERRVDCVPEKRGRQSGFSAARSPERERPREPPVSRPHAGWMAAASITAGAEFVNRSPRGPSRTGASTRSRQRTERRRVPRPIREKPPVRHGPVPIRHGTENPCDHEPIATVCTQCGYEEPRQLSRPGPASTTPATEFRNRE
jgi:hypothetical protein